MKRIWLVRHGSADVPPGIAIGFRDPGLSARGLEQARRLGLELSDLPIRRIVSSDLARARSTAAAIAAWHGLDVELSRALREIDFGRWEGRRLADLWHEVPHEALAWERDLRITPSGFGETFSQLESRVRRFWSALQRTSGETVVVSHRGPLAVMLSLAEGIPLEQAWRRRLEPGAAIVVGREAVA